MSGNSSDADKPDKNAKQLEETILNFLDEEIKVASGLEANQDVPSDDVDALVNSLLLESITVSNEQPDIVVTGAASAENRVAVATSAPSQAVEVKQAQSAPEKKPAVARIAAPQPVNENAARIPVFSAAHQNRAWNGRVLLVAAAVICLVAGTGIVLYKSSRHNPEPKTASAVPAVPASAPSQLTAQVPSAVPNGDRPSAVTGQNATPGPTINRASNAAVATEVPVGKPAPAREAKNASPPPQPRVAGAAAIPQAQSGLADRGTRAQVTEATANSPVRPAEPAPPPQVVSTQMPAASTSSQFDSAISENLPGTVSRDKLSLPARPTSKTAVPPEVIYRVLPTYSELARRARATGTVTIDAIVDAKGTVTNATAVSGPVILHQDAVKAVLQWKFRPATLDGINVPSTSRVNVIFKQP